MKELASFEFYGIDALRPRDNIARMSSDTVSVRLFRRMRTEPLPGMKQPLLNSAIMGLETVLEILFEGKPAVSYQWKLCRLGKGKGAMRVVQCGVVGENGESGDVAIGLFAPHPQYRLFVYSPKKPRKGFSLSSV